MLAVLTRSHSQNDAEGGAGLLLFVWNRVLCVGHHSRLTVALLGGPVQLLPTHHTHTHTHRHANIQPSLPLPTCPLPPQGGGVRVNNDKVEDELAVLQDSDLIDGRLVLIAAGKKNKMLVRVAA